MTLSILITHYKRPDRLKDCIDIIRNSNLTVDYEIIVTDDCSPQKVIDEISVLKIDKLLLSQSNSGLANNLNKGLKACSGDYILYVQEDFIARDGLATILNETIVILEQGKLEMVRLTANYRFQKLEPISENISKIPMFSFQNFKYNTYRYSDHPFIVKKNFFDTYGFYLANSTGPYGETEYAMRILKLNVKVGITTKYYFFQDDHGISVMNPKEVLIAPSRKRKGFKKSIYQYLRSVKLHIEWLTYSPNKRKLFFYKNEFNKLKIT